MRKLFLIYVLFFDCLVNSHAQKGIEGLISAEKSFAAYSVKNSTKEAFLKFLDSSGIVFDNGKPVNGIETWNKREKRPGILNWGPQFAEISESGDFGYTTGPWTFKNSLNDTVVAKGQYTTVWHMSNNGEWKFLVDLGVGNTPANTITEVKKVEVAKQFFATGVIPHVAPVVNAENRFLSAVSKNRSKAYKKYLAAESIVNRNGCLPATGAIDQQKLIDLTSSSIQYKIDGWEMSTNMDMGYVYGTTTINGKTDNYLRIWRWEKGGWKIALEVLRY
jgi:ketosteroid isomerase-like protein